MASVSPSAPSASEDIASDEQAHAHHQPSCPAFLSKLWLLVDDETTNEFIHWSDEGNSFIVRDQVTFARFLLPQFFKHNNMASFIRQLNMYGFRKKAHLDEGALKTERTDIEFQHSHFLKGEIGQLELIKRKVSHKDESKMKPNEVDKILSDVQEVKGKQDNISAKLESIKTENTALWREVVTLRQRHEKQQKIVNRLIHFLISLVQPKVGTTTKRRQVPHLMIEGYPDGAPPSKPKYARTTNMDKIPIRGMKQDGGHGRHLVVGDLVPNMAGSAPAQSRVTELFEDQNFLAGDASAIPAADEANVPNPACPMGSDRRVPTQLDAASRLFTYENAPNKPSPDSEAPSQANTLQFVSQGNFPNLMNTGTTGVEDSSEGDLSQLSTSHLVIPQVSSPDTQDDDTQTSQTPGFGMPITTALSPNISYPMTPAPDTAWALDETSTSEEVFGLDSTGMASQQQQQQEEESQQGNTTTEEGESSNNENLVMNTQQATRQSGLLETPAGTVSRRTVQRLMSNEEHKHRNDLGEQLNLVQSDLHDFQHLLSSNPSLSLELGSLLGDFQGLYEETGPIAIPELSPVLNMDMAPNGGVGGNELRESDLQAAGNELVTYKPSSSSLGSFMAEDEDSLLKSLDDDSASLRLQKESEVTFDL